MCKAFPAYIGKVLRQVKLWLLGPVHQIEGESFPEGDL